ncbi:tannase/feruloyl esterase family alpha/beta hydrolase [Actinoallomurus acaciae]|uniref:Tannase/feruloyl esterase family alpha/beta hydrolase n=1 Tax=Actinoallomurus acaciae TaxID=502577 RepID=A0ABV5YF34_9ACTN
MRRLLILLIALVALPVLAPVATGAVTATTGARCSAPAVTAPPGARVESVTAVHETGGTVTFPPQPPAPAPPPISGVPAYCDITVTLTHPGANDHVRVKVLLPESGWNGRFQAVGGSGYAAGDFGAPLIGAVKAGYAAASTDAGHSLSFVDASWALNADGKVDLPLLRDFASSAPHETAVVGKQVARTFYGRGPAYSYWNGCSTGGRQGYMEAQRYPTDFQGIVADAPAIGWDRFAVATLWPYVVQNQQHTFLTSCEYEAFNAAAVKACDGLDGIRDGVIGDALHCHYDPRKLIGTTIVCGGKPLTITAAAADVVARIWKGPATSAGTKLANGPLPGAGFDGLSAPVTGDDGNPTWQPFVIAAEWVRNFLERRPGADLSTITYPEFTRLFRQSQAEYHDIIGTDDPDLSAFARAGGKLLTFHGLADQLIPTRDTVDYRHRVEQTMGGSKQVDRFYRLFLAPGVAHCGGGGPTPADPLAAVTAWVEHGTAPDTLPATVPGTNTTRDLCRYPLTSHYTGGDPADPADYRCIRA